MAALSAEETTRPIDPRRPSFAIGTLPLRASATTSSRNSLGWGAGMSRYFQRDLPAPQNWCQPNLQRS